MEFRLPVPPIKGDFNIRHQDQMLLLGSCFSENIGQKLGQAGFHTLPGPHGIIYNPLSLFDGIRDIVLGKTFSDADLGRRGEFYFSFNHHGSFSDVSASACLEKINNALAGARDFFPGASIIQITLGTAFVYEHIESGAVVANCHKLPASAFRKRLLSVGEIVQAFTAIQALLPPDARVLFTVSPVRHWRDGAAENTRSKSILITAVHELIEQFPRTHYFPAYELLLDDLRDYRFYTRDMVHPNELAIDYIWERFSETYFDLQTSGLARECMALNQARQHRPLFPGSASQEQFRSALESRIAAFRAQYPFIRI